MTETTCKRMRTAPAWWMALAVLVAVLALLGKATAVLVVGLAVLTQRLAVAAVAGLAWCDEQTSQRAGMPPLAALHGEVI